MKQLFAAILIIATAACANAAEKSVYLGNMGPYTYSDTDVYSDGVNKEGLRSTGQLRVEGTPSSTYDVLRYGDIGSLVLGNGRLTALSVASIADPSAELNAAAGSAVGDLRFCYEDTSTTPMLWTIYAYDSGTGQTENVPFTVDGSSGIWVAVAGQYTVTDFTTGDDLIVTDDASVGGNLTVTGNTTVSGESQFNGITTINTNSGATQDFTVNGDTATLLSTSASADTLTIGASGGFATSSAVTTTLNGPLVSENTATFNNGSGATADVVINGDTVASIFSADVSANDLAVDGLITFNDTNGSTADVIIDGDTTEGWITNDVSAEKVVTKITSSNYKNEYIIGGSVTDLTTVTHTVTFPYTSGVVGGEADVKFSIINNGVSTDEVAFYYWVGSFYNQNGTTGILAHTSNSNDIDGIITTTVRTSSTGIEFNFLPDIDTTGGSTSIYQFEVVQSYLAVTD